MRFRVIAIYDLQFADLLLLGTRQDLTGPEARGAYLDRWPVEGVPQAAKGILGADRQFVFGDESRHRLPEVTLLAGPAGDRGGVFGQGQSGSVRSPLLAPLALL